MEMIYYFIRSFFAVNYCEECERLGLTHVQNIFGDEANYFRSIWKDKYGNTWYCKQRY